MQILTKRSKIWAYIKILMFALVVIFLTLSLDLYISIGQYLSPAFVKSEFIQQHSVFLDPRVESMGGSWNNKNQIHDQRLVEFVYDKLVEQLKIKDKVLLLDIGANTGSFSLLPILNKNINVISFEPNLRAADVLRANVALNHIKQNVVILPIGLSNRNALPQLQIPNVKDKGLATFGENAKRFDSNSAEHYPSLVMTLDQIMPLVIKDNKSVDFIKIDTEGWEYYVLLGGLETLQKYKPDLLLEFNHTNMAQTKVDPDKVLALLESLNYKCAKITSEDIFCQQ